MTPTFADEEYRRLMMLTYLGEWMMNALRKDPDPAYLDTASKIYSFAKGTTLEELVTFEADDESWSLSKAFEDDAHAVIDQYDDKTFWEELTARMTERDLIASRGERAVRGMRPAERARAASAIAKAYTKEFEERGIDRLMVKV